MIIDEVMPALLRALATSRAAVCCAPPGAGKTTRVPPAILAAGLGNEGRIVVLQPRRMAARAVASMMARERGEAVGETIGYQVRFDRRFSDSTRILFMTEGVLTRRFLRDPFLEGIGCVVLDEFHERSVEIDLALAFTRELMQVRDDLRLLVMSATLDAEPVSRYLGGCPVVTSPGRPFPLSLEHASEDSGSLPERCVNAVCSLFRRSDDDGGDILIFLAGVAEIRATGERLRAARLPGDPEILSLHGSLPPAEQDRVLLAGGRRRIILATNIAETSLTVPGVTAVVDSGWCKMLRLDPSSGLDRLERSRISRHSAEQRAGRAARTAPGRVVRLWSRHEDRGLLNATPPEIQRVDIAPMLQSLLGFRPGNPAGFPFFESPGEAALERALKLLRLLGVVEQGSFRLSGRGQRITRIPAHPRIGCILDQARQVGLEQDGALIAALLSEREARTDRAQPAATDSDLLDRMERFRRQEQEGRAPHAVRVTRRQYASIARSLERCTGGKKARHGLSGLVLTGYPDRVCRRRRKGSDEAVMVGGRGVRLSPESGVRSSELFVALDADAGRRTTHSAALVRQASAVSGDMLRDTFPHLLREECGGYFDASREAVVGLQRRFFADLLIEERTGVGVNAEVAAGILAEEAGRHFAEIFRPDETTERLRARILFVARTLPEHEWPDVSDEGLVRALPGLCRGKSSFAELRRLDWCEVLRTGLNAQERKMLEQDAPERIQVPSGSRIALDYRPEEVPVLAVRLQEVFGLGETPRIARGRVQLRLHLLAPNGRPVQVTSDLASFWSNTYPEVRKELRARYPRHAWPEDPWSAKAIRGAKRRRK